MTTKLSHWRNTKEVAINCGSAIIYAGMSGRISRGMYLIAIKDAGLFPGPEDEIPDCESLRAAVVATSITPG